MIDDFSKILNKVLTNETSILFIGKEFIKGAKNSFGEIPDDNKLKSLLISSFLGLTEGASDFELLMQTSIDEIYRYIANENKSDELLIFLNQYFTKLEPNNEQKTITEYPWSKIYTANIDDLIENIFLTQGLDLNINDNDKQIRQVKDFTELLKLNGSIESQNVSFGADEFDVIHKSKDYRQNSLCIDIQKENFIFIGFNFSEINIDYYLKLYETSGFISGKGKLIFILESSNILIKSKIKKVGGIIIDWSFSKFAEFLKLFAHKKPFAIKKAENIQGFRDIAKIREQLNLVKESDSKLYFGNPPEWIDIFQDWDIINPKIIKDFFDFVDSIDSLSDSNEKVFSIYGKAFTGKSVFLKRLAVELFNRGYIVFEYYGKYFNYFDLHKYVRNSEHDTFAIIIDDASNYYNPLKILINNFPKEKELIVITTSRTFYHIKKRYSIVGFNYYEFFLNSEIDNSFAENILNKIKEKGFLGELSKINDKEEQINAIKKDVDISSVLFKLTYGPGFLERFYSSLNDMSRSKNAKEVLIKLAIFNKLDLPYFPLELINFVYHGESQQILEEIEDLIRIKNDSGIELRIEPLAEKILHNLKSDVLIENIRDILINISPQINDNINSYWNEIQASLIKEKVLRQRLRLKTTLFKQMLNELRKYYSDNYNYWLQLGIAEQLDFEFDKALNHFRQAESLRPNSYMVKNAIGRNFLKQANSNKSVSKAKTYFDVGEKILLELIKNKEEFQVRAFSTHCYLYEKINYIKKFNLEISDKELKSMYNMLQTVMQKDPNDIISKHINNHFYKFLRHLNKTNIINLKFEDVSKLKAILFSGQMDIETLFEDFEID